LEIEAEVRTWNPLALEDDMATQTRHDRRTREIVQPADLRDLPGARLVALIALLLLWLALSTAGADGSGLDAPGEIGDNDFRISDMGPNLSDAYEATLPDVAHNSANNRFLVVWMGDNNTPPQVNDEYEIWGQRINAATGAAVWSNDFRISQAGPDGDVGWAAEEPAAAYNPTDNQYLVVWSGSDDADGCVAGEQEIWGQRVDGATRFLIGDSIRISHAGGTGITTYSAWQPDVVYNGVSGEYLVVWSGEDSNDGMVDYEYEIFLQRIDAATGVEIGGDERISDAGGLGDSSYGAFGPKVAFNSFDNQYLVVWYGKDDLPGIVEREIWGQRLSATGAEIGANDFRISDMGPDGDTAFEPFLPEVAYNSVDNEYLVVWSGDDVTDNEREIWGQRLSADGIEIGVNDFRISDMGPDGAVVFGTSEPAVAYDATFNTYLVAWRGDDDLVGVNENEIFGQYLDAATGAEIGGNDVRLSDMGPDGSTDFNVEYPSVAYNSTDNQYLVVWSGDTLEPLTLADEEFEIFGQRVLAGVLFSDHFETGDLLAWTIAAP
jgi:hypothetical protein